MLGALLAGVSPSLRDGDDEHEDQGGVILRREQVKLVLFEGKMSVVEETHSGTGLTGFLFVPWRGRRSCM